MGMFSSDKAIPNFISADSPQGLRRQMMMQNSRDRFVYTYTDIAQMDGGKWIAWYRTPVVSEKEKDDLISNTGE